MTQNIGIIDYGAGNIGSIPSSILWLNYVAFRMLGFDLVLG